MSLNDEELNYKELHSGIYGLYKKKDVKEKVQNAQRRLKGKAEVRIAERTLDIGEDLLTIKRKDIDKIFLEEFGEGLLK